VLVCLTAESICCFLLCHRAEITGVSWSQCSVLSSKPRQRRWL